MCGFQSTQNHQQTPTPSMQHRRRETSRSTREPVFTGVKFSNFMQLVQRKVPSLSPTRALGRLHSHGGKASPHPTSMAYDGEAKGLLSPGTDVSPDSQRLVDYSAYQPLATCEVVESWLVTAEERKRTQKKARKARKCSLVKDSDQLW